MRRQTSALEYQLSPVLRSTVAYRRPSCAICQVTQHDPLAIRNRQITTKKFDFSIFSSCRGHQKFKKRLLDRKRSNPPISPKLRIILVQVGPALFHADLLAITESPKAIIMKHISNCEWLLPVTSSLPTGTQLLISSMAAHWLY